MASKRKRSSSSAESVDDWRRWTDQLCACCASMTGSLEGLRALTSTGGYKHHSKPELEASAQSGCQCCKVLWAEACDVWRHSSKWDPRVVAIDARGMLISGRVIKGESLRVFENQKLSCLRYKRDARDDTAIIDMFVSSNQRKLRYSVFVKSHFPRLLSHGA
jgi:hypothetical protein